MANKAVQVKILDSGVALLLLDLEGTKVNVLGTQAMTELNQAIDQLSANPEVKGLVIASGKSDNFVAGADIAEIKAIQRQEPAKAYEASKLGKEVFGKIEALPFNTVAAINGTCLGGGTELALACRIRLATNSPKTKIGLPEVQLGVIPGWGGCVRLPELIGRQAALDLIASGKTVDARRAWKLGLVDEIVEPSNLEARAIEVAAGGSVKRFKAPLKARLMKGLLEGNPIGRKVLSNIALKTVKAQTRGKYPAPVEAVKLVLKGATMRRDKAFEAESRAFARMAVSDVSRNLVGIFFAQQDSKKAPAGVKPALPIKTVGVLGAGIMGSGIAQAAAYAGYNVVLFDINPDALKSGLQKIEDLFAKLVEKRKLTREEADARVKAVKTTTSYEDFAECELVIEAIVEKMEAKRAAITALDKVIKHDYHYVFASNTSSLVVSEMAEAARKPSHVVGMHFFNPVHQMPLVELVRSRHAGGTAEEVLAVAREFCGKLGKTTVTVGDSPGFVVNRVLAPYLTESIKLMEQGVPLEDIEKAMTSFGMPMGPFELLDHVGLDICGHVTRALAAQIGPRLAAPPIMAKLEALKLLGKKGGRGFYLYDDGKKAGFNPDVLATVTAPRMPKTRGEIQDRLVLTMVNEAILCLQEGVIEDPAQLDLAMIMGTGFPPYLGGLLRYADSVGTRVVLQKLEWLSKVSGENYRPADLLVATAAAGKPFRQDLA
jgi:3-hydroxyacyl-CoA dehydrogenase/enoyl-CoA hydratase/3-hydroxybutyryl-CoA epimerase